MSEAFDAYHRWLGIPLKDQPPNHYRLLGIDLYENDPEVIRDAAERQITHVRKYQLGPHSAISQKILNEIALAKTCLLDRNKKAAYDSIFITGQSKTVDKADNIEGFIPTYKWLDILELIKKNRVPKLMSKRATYLISGIFFIAIINLAVLIIPWKQQESVPSASILEPEATRKSNNQNPAKNTKGPLSPAILSKVDHVPKPNPPPEQKQEKNRIQPLEEKQARQEAIPPGRAPEIPRPPNNNHNVVQQQPVAQIVISKDLQTSLAVKDQSQSKSINPSLPKLQPSNNPIPPSRNDRTSQPGIFESEITMTLPSGKVFDSRIFDINVKSVKERLKIKVDKMLKDKNSNENVVILQTPKGSAWAEIDKNDGKLDNVCLTLNQTEAPIIYAEYTDDKPNGIIKKWNEKGQPEYCCQYKNNLRDGFCCYFVEDILVMLFEIKRNQINAVHLCSNSTLEQSFTSDVEASKNSENAKILIADVKKIEAELKSIDREYVNQINKWRNKRIGELHKMLNADAQDRINQRANQRQDEINALRIRGTGGL